MMGYRLYIDQHMDDRLHFRNLITGVHGAWDATGQPVRHAWGHSGGCGGHSGGIEGGIVADGIWDGI